MSKEIKLDFHDVKFEKQNLFAIHYFLVNSILGLLLIIMFASCVQVCVDGGGGGGGGGGWGGGGGGGGGGILLMEIVTAKVGYNTNTHTHINACTLAHTDMHTDTHDNNIIIII